MALQTGDDDVVQPNQTLAALVGRVLIADGPLAWT